MIDFATSATTNFHSSARWRPRSMWWVLVTYVLIVVSLAACIWYDDFSVSTFTGVRGKTQRSDPMSIRNLFFVISSLTKKLLVLDPLLFAALSVGSPRFPNCSFMADDSDRRLCLLGNCDLVLGRTKIARLNSFVSSVIWFSRPAILFSIDEDCGVREALATWNGLIQLGYPGLRQLLPCARSALSQDASARMACSCCSRVYFESHLIAFCSTTFACVRSLITLEFTILATALPALLYYSRCGLVLRKLKNYVLSSILDSRGR